MADQPLEYYLDRYFKGNITREERILLAGLLDDESSKEQFAAVMEASWKDWNESDLSFPEVANRVKRAIADMGGNDANDSLTQADSMSKLQIPPVVHRVHFLRKWGWAAAALIVLGTGAYLWLQKPSDGKEVVTTKPLPVQDIAPGKQQALLTLADGTTIKLDSTANGRLAEQFGSTVRKQGGEIIYDAGQHSGEGVTYNTMSTPRGGQYKLTLTDGTKVWLNAASSIIYPTTFTGKTREVTITGEAYFEVRKNKEKPFIVKTIKEEITVLGTSFNVNAYPDEPSMKTSLLEGSIKIGDTFVKPGQAYENGKLKNTNIQQDVAWKNGAFDFTDRDLRSVMKQLARWYDVNVVYEKNVPDMTFRGKMGRDLTLNQILKALSATGVNFTLEGKQLIVKP